MEHIAQEQIVACLHGFCRVAIIQQDLEEYFTFFTYQNDFKFLHVFVKENVLDNVYFPVI